MRTRKRLGLAALAGGLIVFGDHIHTNLFAANAPLFTGIARLENGSIRLDVSGSTGSVYQLQFSSNCASWTPLTILTNAAGVLQFTDAPAPADLQRFYRLQTALGTNSVYWTRAQQTHNFVVGNLLTAYDSYRIEPGSSTAYQWYCASQIYADAAMVSGDSRYVPYMNNGYVWMNNLWDGGNPAGGYFAAGHID